VRRNGRGEGTNLTRCPRSPDSATTGVSSLDAVLSTIVWSRTNSGVIFSCLVDCSRGRSSDACSIFNSVPHHTTCTKAYLAFGHRIPYLCPILSRITLVSQLLQNSPPDRSSIETYVLCCRFEIHKLQLPRCTCVHVRRWLLLLGQSRDSR